MAKTTLRKFAAEKGNYAEMQNTSGEPAISLNDPDSIFNEDHFAVRVWGGDEVVELRYLQSTTRGEDTERFGR
ncbi:hypothetical protein RUM43_002425, partial [Polyplax serrata]